jgi:hypothetical protein
MACGRWVMLTCAAASLVGAFTCLEAAITPQIGATRTTGVAPLAVFVDATTTAGLDGNDYVNANFDWDFDRDGVDPAGKHTVTRGFVAAHVYENPGTYTIQLAVHDRLGATATATQQIVVTPFTGTTYYVATGGSNSAAGTSMSAPLATPEYAISNKGGPNTRVLLRRGDRFTIAPMTVSKTGPMIVGAYTDPNSPSTALPMMYCTASGDGMVNVSNSSDLRFMDFHLRSLCPNPHDGTGTGQRAGTIYSNTTDMLILRVEVDSVNHNGFLSDARNTFIFDCYYHDYGTYGFFSGDVSRLAIVGLVSRRLGSGQHFIRLQGGSKAFIAYNEDTESSVNYDGFTIREGTSQVCLVGNRFSNVLSVLADNREAGEHDGHFVLDGNTVSDGDIIMRANHISFRNNIIRNGGIGIGTSPIAGSDPMNVTICNNSFHGTNYEMVFGSSTNVTIKNNVFHTTTADATGMRLDNALSNYQIDNNIYYKQSGSLSFGVGGFANWQVAGADAHGRIVNPQFASTDPSSPDFLKLSANSPARGNGAVVPVFCDVAGTPRPAGQATDAGAWLYGSSVGVRPAARASASQRTEFTTSGGQAYDLRGRFVRMPPDRSAHGAAGVVIVGSGTSLR